MRPEHTRQVWSPPASSQGVPRGDSRGLPQTSCRTLRWATWGHISWPIGSHRATLRVICIWATRRCEGPSSWQQGSLAPSTIYCDCETLSKLPRGPNEHSRCNSLGGGGRWHQLEYARVGRRKGDEFQYSVSVWHRDHHPILGGMAYRESHQAPSSWSICGGVVMPVLISPTSWAWPLSAVDSALAPRSAFLSLSIRRAARRGRLCCAAGATCSSAGQMCFTFARMWKLVADWFRANRLRRQTRRRDVGAYRERLVEDIRAAWGERRMADDRREWQGAGAELASASTPLLNLSGSGGLASWSRRFASDASGWRDRHTLLSVLARPGSLVAACRLRVWLCEALIC